MIKKSTLIICMFIYMFVSIFAYNDSVECNIVYASECSGTTFFAVPTDGNFTDLNGNVISANVATGFAPNYGKVLCCNSAYGEFGVTTVNENAGETCGDDIDLFYFTNTTNARISFADDRNDIESYNADAIDLVFNPAFYKTKLCVSVPDGFGTFDIVVSDKENYKNIGYDCMFKVSSLVNGVVSSCDAQYDGTNQYLYSVWGRMFESLASLECNVDCTSKLDGRVYSACSQKVSSCSPLKSLGDACNGSLLGNWVDYNTSHEVQCLAPWSTLRKKVFTDDTLDVSVASGSECDNMISKKTTVLLNNEQVTMSIYICRN